MTLYLTLVAYQVELLSFRGEELAEDGGIIRRIKVKGEGYNNPNDGATVHGMYLNWILQYLIYVFLDK